MFETFNRIITIHLSNADVTTLRSNVDDIYGWLNGAVGAYNTSFTLSAGSDGFMRVKTGFAVRSLLRVNDSSFGGATLDGAPEESIELHNAIEVWNSGSSQWVTEFNGSNLATLFDALASAITNSTAAGTPGLSEYASGGTIGISSINLLDFGSPNLHADAVSGA